MQMKITNKGYKTKETNYMKLTPNTDKYARINEQILAPTVILFNLLIMSHKRKIGRPIVFHLQNRVNDVLIHA